MDQSKRDALVNIGKETLKGIAAVGAIVGSVGYATRQVANMHGETLCNYTGRHFSSRDYEVSNVDDRWNYHPNIDEQRNNQFEVRFKETGNVADLLIERTGQHDSLDRFNDTYNIRVTQEDGQQNGREGVTRQNLRSEVDQLLMNAKGYSVSKATIEPEEIIACGLAGGVIAASINYHGNLTGADPNKVSRRAILGALLGTTMLSLNEMSLDNRARDPSKE